MNVQSNLNDVAVNDIIDSIKEDSQKIRKDLSTHPQAGEKFLKLSKYDADAWVAWTWFYRKLISLGLSDAAAIDVRNRVMEEQHRYGTYEAMALCLNSLEFSEDDEYGLI